MTRSHALHLLFAAAALSPPTAAQEAVRLLDGLGDPERGAAAAQALLELREQAVPALQGLIEEWQVRQPRDLERMRAALQVVDLLGETAASLKSPLVEAITGQNTNDDKLLVSILTTIGSLTPYGDKVEFHNLFHFSMVASDKEKGATFTAIYRYRERDEAKVTDLESARRCLQDDKIFAREVAAEFLGRLGTAEDAAALRDRLLARDQRPKGWDQVKHNGFVVPVEDRFSLFGGLALVRLAPEDSVSIIGHAMVARHHPYPARRRQALLALTRFGPEVEVAVPELIAVATGGEPKLAAEALKVLGMAGKSVGRHLRAIDALEQHEDQLVARLAGSLAARLRAMGCEAPPATAAADEASRKLAAMREAVAAIDGRPREAAPVRAAEQLIAADPDTAWPLLMERLQREMQNTPDALIRCMAELGSRRPEAERLELRSVLVMTGDRWSTPFCSSHSGGRGMTDTSRDAYGVLTVGAPEHLDDVAALLTDDNAAVRLAAARLCARRAAEVGAAGAPLRDALWRAVSGDHPAKSQFDQGGGSRTTLPLDLGDEIRAAAAAALRETEQPQERHGELVRRALLHGADGEVAAAVLKFGAAADRADLERAAKNISRKEVAAAAKQVLEQRGDK
ncbi:MAG: hypothetical protein H6838_02140 [Planctomycetes bacterium]|nr:hypothetical protein [Planctomycetota bacterium]